MDTSVEPEGRFVVALVGGACAGAEVASRLAAQGFEVVVFEQNPRPYGKIEDGLPRWHARQRLREYKLIDEKLSHPRVHFVPETGIGRDIDFVELVEGWGFSATILACGAWRDRPLPIEGVDDYINRGLIYQNDFIYWFNHCHESGYQGPAYQVAEGALIIGGGLASIDVAKVEMLMLAQQALARRGIEEDLEQLERWGIPRTLSNHDLTMEDLDLKPATIFYRRRIQDMPLMTLPKDADEAKRAKVTGARLKIIERATTRYAFKVEPLSVPDGLIIEDGRLVGLRFRRTEITAEGRLVKTDETFERRGPHIISSIGSVPVPIKGIPQRGEMYDFTDWHLGRLAPWPNVYAAGNVITGKGNIAASRRHGSEIGEHVVARLVGVADEEHATEGNATEGDDLRPALKVAQAGEQAEAIADALPAADRRSPAEIEALLMRVRARQAAVGFGGDYPAWIKTHTPPEEGR